MVSASDFPDRGCCASCYSSCGNEALVESWTKEREAWQEGRIAACCGYGCLYRIQEVTGDSLSIPNNLCISITGISCGILQAAWGVVRTVECCLCCSVKCCCEDAYAQSVKNATNTWVASCVCLTNGCYFGARAAEDVACCLPNLVAEEALNSCCDQPKRLLNRSIKDQTVSTESRTILMAMNED